MSEMPKSVREVVVAAIAFTAGFDSGRTDLCVWVKVPITTGEGAAF